MLDYNWGQVEAKRAPTETTNGDNDMTTDAIQTKVPVTFFFNDGADDGSEALQVLHVDADEVTPCVATNWPDFSRYAIAIADVLGIERVDRWDAYIETTHGHQIVATSET